VIQRLLEIEREPLSVKGLGVEAEADWDYLARPKRISANLRSDRFASPTAHRGLHRLSNDQGSMLLLPESGIHVGRGQGAGTGFHGRDGQTRQAGFVTVTNPQKRRPTCLS
jgi:hypothetical protein